QDHPVRLPLPAAVGAAAALVAVTAVTVAAVGVPSAARPSVAAAPRAVLDRPVEDAASRSRPVAQAPVRVARLAHLLVPDLLVTTSRPITAAQAVALRHLRGVTGSTVVGTGTLHVGQPGHTREIRAFGVDPSAFRGFTPRQTAASDALWAAVARGDLAASYAARLPLGATVPVAGATRTTAHLGAVADYGLPGVDLVVDRARSRELGLRDTSALVAAPSRGISSLRRSVRDLLGPGVDVTVLRPVPITYRRPASYRELYQLSATYCPGLSWKVLAAIGQIESGHGRNVGPSSAGALGPMQFLPTTWAYAGVDGDGDGKADIMSAYDAVPAASLYLCRDGAGRGGQYLYNAVFSYNHADWYVREVLDLAARYR
ncbi:MAG: lytic murein transglycosylase, partial [Mycobacteriales bacterium]